jgi:MFS transporter, ACS family, tartrate transporter
MGTIEQQTVAKIWWHVIPLFVGGLFIAHLDRANLGFAALTMLRDLGLSNTQFGTASGAFALGYMAFGIPSTLMLHRWGARRWIPLMMVAWGIFSAATAFVSGPTQLLIARLGVGAAEAGFAPGAVFYISRWIPSEYRGRVLASLFFIVPLSQIIGGPLSSGLLVSLNGIAGLKGWQWLLLLEALPAVAWAVVMAGALSDTPAKAAWLSPEQMSWLTERLRGDEQQGGATLRPSSARRAFATPRVWALAAIGAGLGTSAIGTLIFLPLIIRSMGFSIGATGLVSAVPSVVGALLLPLWGLWADRSRSRELVVAVGCGAMAAGLLVTAILLPSPWALIPVSVVLAAFFGIIPPFLNSPTAFLSGSGAAAAIGLISVAGNLGQAVGPYVLGHRSDLDHSYTNGLAWLAAIAAGTTIIAIVLIRARAPKPVLSISG